MSTAIKLPTVATVVSISGEAFARNADGAVRRLAAGDAILQGETVFTLANGQVELAFADGHTATLLASESYLLGPETMIATSPVADDAAIAAAGEIERVVQALEEGGDILEGLEPTAAGGVVAENSGNSFVRLLRIAEGITPVGYEFGGNPSGEIRAPEGEAVPEPEEPGPEEPEPEEPEPEEPGPEEPEPEEPGPEEPEPEEPEPEEPEPEEPEPEEPEPEEPEPEEPEPEEPGDGVRNAAFFTMNTSNTRNQPSTGHQQFRISITSEDSSTQLSQTVQVADEQGQQDFYVFMGGDVVFANDTRYAVTLEYIDGSAHLNFTRFSISDKDGNVVELNAKEGSNNVTLTGGEQHSYDGAVYIITVDGSGNIDVSDPVGYDVNTINGDYALFLDSAIAGQVGFTLDMADLPIGASSNDIDLFGEIDRIDISGSGKQEDNTLRLSAQDVLDLVNDDDYKLWISGDDGDAVVLTDSGNWTKGDTSVPGPDGGIYTVYTATVDSTSVALYVENEVTQPAMP